LRIEIYKIQDTNKMGNSSTKNLGERPQEFPLSLPGPADIIAVQSVPERHFGIMEETGRVRQMDYNKTVVGWVDAKGNAYRNDYNKTRVGWVDLNTRKIYQADYNKTQIGSVDEEGRIFASSSVVHQSGTNIVIGKIIGPKDSQVFAACAFFLLF
jgi:hypothetical protein